MLRKIKNYYHLFIAWLACFYYKFPAYKITIIGVTGTDGKTTTSSLIYHLLRSNGYKVGLISTIGAKINDMDYSIGLHATTPAPFLLQRLLSKMIKEKCQFAVLEVTSHAIDQKRIYGIPFSIGILTNITHDHLDYHQTMNKYIAVKLKFLNSCALRIINSDDPVSQSLVEFLLPPVVTYAVKNKAKYQALNREIINYRQQFYFNKKKISTYLLGEYNLSNILAALSVVSELNLPAIEMVKAFDSFAGVSGRREIICLEPFSVIVDFAHTPNAFLQILNSLKESNKGKIIHVFGATGKRDRSKRPLMGEISGKIADYSILTSEDTYGEDPQIIIKEIELGLKKTAKIINQNYFIEPDRKKAISKAFNLAKKDDVVIITGVGHQQSLQMGKFELPWNEKEIIKDLLKNSC